MSNPNPEERERITRATVKRAIEAHPMFQEEKANELVMLRNKMHAAIEAVATAMKPIVEVAKMLPPKDPRYIHSETGRVMVIEQALKMFLDHAKQWDRDELIFLLSLEYAQRVVDNFV